MAQLLTPSRLLVARQVILLLSILVLMINRVVDLPTSALIMTLMLPAVVYIAPELQSITIGAFVFGALADSSLNYLSKNGTNGRWKYMRMYFEEVGDFTAALFAGALTAWMVLDTVALTNALNPLVGFGVGAFWGVLSQYAKAFEPLLPFYLNTPYGYIENRAWDGFSTMLAVSTLLLMTPG